MTDTPPVMNAAIFDMDGTLLDSLEDIAFAVNAALKRMGLPAHEKEHYRTAVGDGVRQLVERCLPPDQQNEKQAERLAALVREEYGSHWDVATRLFPGIPDMLDRLSGMGVVLAVLTNKTQRFADLCAKKYLGKWMFHRVQGVGGAFERKPDPAGALDIARTMCIEPARILYCGDTPTDMKTGRGAGMFTVGVSWGFRPVEELVEAGAMAVVDDPMELLGFFSRD